VSNAYCVVFLLCFSSSCVPKVASFSISSIFGSPFGNLWRLFILWLYAYACYVGMFAVSLMRTIVWDLVSFDMIGRLIITILLLKTTINTAEKQWYLPIGSLLYYLMSLTIFDI
jgi:hypothetical protein